MTRSPDPPDRRVPGERPPGGRHLPTLTRQLVVRVTLVVAALSAVICLSSTAVAQRLMMNQLDRRLVAVASRQEGAVDNPGKGYPGGVDLPGQPIGTVVLEVENNVALHGMLTDAGVKPLPDQEAVRILSELPTDGSAHSVNLPILGLYRAVSVERDGHRVIIGLPRGETRNAIVTLVVTTSTLGIVCVAAAAIGVYLVVSDKLRPITDLAATAREVAATPLEHGQVGRLVRMPRDQPAQATEVADVGEAFNQMLGHVESALRARELSETKVRRFVADASHELRNPLAAIRGYAELTRRHRQELPAQTARSLDRIDAEAERMSALVEDMLLLARLDANPAPATEPVDLSEIVVNAIADAQAAGPDHRWSLNVPPEPVVTLGSRHQLHQVVTNLLANARTHTPAGTSVRAVLTVERDPRHPDRTAVLEIHDNGPGIPAGQLGSIFDRFVRGDTARARMPGGSASRSTGLGLSIVRAVVSAHGGTVGVASRCLADIPNGQAVPGTSWTSFTIRLPIDDRADRPAA